MITNVHNAGQWGHLEERAAGGRADAVAGAAIRRPAASRRICPSNVRAAGAARRDAGRCRTWARSRRKADASGMPANKYSCAQPPWGELIAVNANTGDIAWRIPLGEFPELDGQGHQDGPAESRRRHHDGRQSRLHRRVDRRHLPRHSTRATARSSGARSSRRRRIRFRRPTWARTASSTSRCRRAAADSCAVRRPTRSSRFACSR